MSSGLTPGKLAHWIYANHDTSIYEENGKYHVSTTYFTELQNRPSVVSWVSLLTNRVEIASLIGVSQGWDHGSQMIATWVGMELPKPSYAITEGELDEGLPIEVRSSLSNCALLLCYTSFGQQVMDVLESVEKHGGNAVKVITLVDERGEAERVCQQKRAEFHRLFSTSDIIRSLQGLQNVNTTSITKIMQLLSQA